MFRSITSTTASDSARSVSPRRIGRPSGRAVAGGLLVALSALSVLSVGRSGADGPGTRYVVARRAIPPGTRLAASDLETTTADVAAPVAARLFTDPEPLVGSVTLAPFAEAELIQLAAVLPRAATRTDAVPPHEFSFALDRARAIDGDLRPGEAIDLLATYGADQGAYTVTVARSALVLDVESRSADLGQPEGLVLTVGLADRSTVLAVVHAAAADALTVVRSPVDPAGPDAPGAPYQPPGPTAPAPGAAP
ncbi:MAG TPA: SAF domain-containing protein [Acidimicrobiales bacterium]|nr:SAF domain-containing protein [Acidimicrobiales bacterium]